MTWLARTIFALVAFCAQDATAQANPSYNKGSAAFLRFACSQLVIDRIDPLVNPGQLPATHMHQIVGGNSFNVTMDPSSIDPPAQSTCTSCKMVEDFSNYWTASIYFRSPDNGTFTRIPQMANGRLNGTMLEQEGGITVYYMRPFSGRDMTMTAMQPGFRMLAGDPSIRTKPSGPMALCHRCLSASQRTMGGNGAPCSSGDTSEFPVRGCPGGIRATVIFPSCWDGKNSDSADHKSHVAYARGNQALAGDVGGCPDTHPVRIPQVMYEIMYDTSAFADPKYYQNGQQPLVYSFGDTTGHGQHGDYLFGWKDDALQRAMDGLGTSCFSEWCEGALKLQPNDDLIACTKEQQYQEDIGTDGWIAELPGISQLQ